MLQGDKLYNLASVPLDDVLARSGVGPHDWDWLVLGDGSGTGWGHGCGWACLAVDRLGAEGENRTLWTGAANYGSAEFAEVMALLHPLYWVAEQERERQKRRREPKPAYVHVFTDCAPVCRKAAVREGEADRLAWRPFDEFERHGLLLKWHHVPRETLGLHCVVDRVSRAARNVYGMAAPDWPVVRSCDGRALGSVYDVNPAR